nr:MAG TPA: hypothetical protein [Caudoviricetes sp.]
MRSLCNGAGRLMFFNQTGVMYGGGVWWRLLQDSINWF